MVDEIAAGTPSPEAIHPENRASRPHVAAVTFRLTLTWDTRYPVDMADALTRRALLRQAGIVAALTAVARPSEARRGDPQIYGVGRIGDPIAGRTIPGPSDFGFTVDPQGGTFVCSMFGETGGFKGCNIMTVQGGVTPRSLQIFRGTATFSGKVDIFVQPDVFVNIGDPFLSLADLDFQVEAKLGGPGKASMILTIPAATPAVGGDTGGVLQFGRIERRRVR